LNAKGATPVSADFITGTLIPQMTATPSGAAQRGSLVRVWVKTMILRSCHRARLAPTQRHVPEGANV